jgi:hypothetical protein
VLSTTINGGIRARTGGIGWREAEGVNIGMAQHDDWNWQVAEAKIQP